MLVCNAECFFVPGLATFKGFVLPVANVSDWQYVAAGAIEHLDELVEHADIEFDLSPGMTFLVHSLLPFVPVALVEVCLG